MATLQFKCPECSADLRIDERKLVLLKGEGKCPKCGADFRLSLDEDEPSPAEGPELPAPSSGVVQAGRRLRLASHPCVNCGRAMDVEDTVCVHCGTIQKTGELIASFRPGNTRGAQKFGGLLRSAERQVTGFAWSILYWAIDLGKLVFAIILVCLPLYVFWQKMPEIKEFMKGVAAPSGMVAAPANTMVSSTTSIPPELAREGSTLDSENWRARVDLETAIVRLLNEIKAGEIGGGQFAPDSSAPVLSEPDEWQIQSATVQDGPDQTWTGSATVIVTGRDERGLRLRTTWKFSAVCATNQSGYKKWIVKTISRF